MKSCHFKATRDMTTTFGLVTLGNNINKWLKVGRHDWPSCMISDNFKKVILLYVYYMGYIDFCYRVYLGIWRVFRKFLIFEPVVHNCQNLLGTQSWFLAYLGTLWVPIPSFYPNRTKPFAFGSLWSANFRQPPLEPPLRSLGGFRGGFRGALGGPGGPY